MKKRVFTSVVRFILAIVFLFSGIVKAVDPLGTAYKIEEYLQHFGIDFLLIDDIPVMLSVLLAFFEFIIGVNLFFGIRRKFSFALAYFFMLFMTPLTLYLYLVNPVSDCGCFGDAIVLSNGTTFFKNLFLLLLFVWLSYDHKNFFRLVSHTNQWLVSIYSFIFLIGLSIYSIHFLPLVDFRPYSIGVNIQEEMRLPEGAKETVFKTSFLMEKNGEQKTFTLENYPDSTWTFIERKTEIVSQGDVPKITDFFVSNAEGDDVTKELLEDTTYTFLLIAPTLENADDGSIDRINEIYDYCSDHGYRFMCLTSSGSDAITKWCDKSGALYPFLSGDEVVLKTIIRSNPGLMLLKKGTILEKWSYNNFIETEQLPFLMQKIKMPLKRNSVPLQLLQLIMWYVLPLLVLIFFEQLVAGIKNLRRKSILKRNSIHLNK